MTWTSLCQSGGVSLLSCLDFIIFCVVFPLFFLFFVQCPLIACPAPLCSFVKHVQLKERKKKWFFIRTELNCNTDCQRQSKKKKCEDYGQRGKSRGHGSGRNTTAHIQWAA